MTAGSSKRCPRCGNTRSYQSGPLLICEGCGESLAEAWAPGEAVTDLMEGGWIEEFRKSRGGAAGAPPGVHAEPAPTSPFAQSPFAPRAGQGAAPQAAPPPAPAPAPGSPAPGPLKPPPFMGVSSSLAPPGALPGFGLTPPPPAPMGPPAFGAAANTPHAPAGPIAPPIAPIAPIAPVAPTAPNPPAPPAPPVQMPAISAAGSLYGTASSGTGASPPPVRDPRGAPPALTPGAQAAHSPAYVPVAGAIPFGPPLRTIEDELPENPLPAPASFNEADFLAAHGAPHAPARDGKPPAFGGGPKSPLTPPFESARAPGSQSSESGGRRAAAKAPEGAGARTTPDNPLDGFPPPRVIRERTAGAEGGAKGLEQRASPAPVADPTAAGAPAAHAPPPAGGPHPPAPHPPAPHSPAPPQPPHAAAGAAPAQADAAKDAPSTSRERSRTPRAAPPDQSGRIQQRVVVARVVGSDDIEGGVKAQMSGIGGGTIRRSRIRNQRWVIVEGLLLPQARTLVERLEGVGIKAEMMRPDDLRAAERGLPDAPRDWSGAAIWVVGVLVLAGMLALGLWAMQ